MACRMRWVTCVDEMTTSMAIVESLVGQDAAGLDRHAGRARMTEALFHDLIGSTHGFVYVADRGTGNESDVVGRILVHRRAAARAASIEAAGGSGS